MKKILLLLCLTSTLQAQKLSVITGKIVDKNSGEPLLGATIELIKGGEQMGGTITDFDGSYLLEAEKGLYSLVISYVSYTRQTIEDFEVKEDLQQFDILMESESQTLSEVVVKAASLQNTDASLITLQKKAFSIQDGVSSQQISRTGSSNAADAMRQVTGAVIEGGRFIVMRGLGDRYSIAQINSTSLPSTDPYRNSSSLDMIPSQMIDNIITIKTFTPDLPGNFSGGLVNVTTKAIPDNFNLSLSLSSSFNTRASLVDRFNAFPESGKYDWLGFDDNSRDQPQILQDPASRDLLSSSSYLSARKPENEQLRSVFHTVSQQMSNRFVPTQKRSPLNRGVEFSVGNRYKVLGGELGFSLGVNYDANYTHYDDGQINTFINNSSQNLFPYQALNETKSVFNPTIGALFNLAYKFSGNHLISGNVIFNNDSEFASRRQVGNFLGQVSNSLADFNTNTLEFTQRQVTTYQARGRHVFPKLGGTEIEWTGVRSNSFQREPDLRYFAYTSVAENGITEFFINNAEYAFPYHFFRDLQDEQNQLKLDISIPFLTRGDAGSSNMIKFGGYFNETKRTFEEFRYQLNNSGVPSSLNFTTFNGDFDAFFDYGNFGIIDTLYKESGGISRYNTGYHYINQINAKNFYTGSQSISAAYVMTVLNILPKLKLVGGARLETTDSEVISQDPEVPVGKIDQADWLYSANLIYNLGERTNLRLAASKTLARPNMREIAPFIQFDTKNGFFNVGNPNLERTLIQNYDVRYEFYPRPGELLAVSGFFKSFDQPIIRAFNPRATIPELSFINVDDAMIYGAEIELKKKLDFISPLFSSFYLSTNFVLIHSEYDIPDSEIENSKNIDDSYNETKRPFQGQAPYVANLVLSYADPDLGLESSIAFNVSGEKLYNISLFATPDVYEQPFPLLNYKLSKRIAGNYTLSFTARNILDSLNKKSQLFRGNEYIAESFRLGTSLGLSVTYRAR